MGILMYKFINKLLPPNLMKNFQLVSDHHKYNARSATSNNISLSMPHSELYKQSLNYLGPALWNSLPLQIRSSASLDSFKKKFKMLILNE